MAGGFKPGHPPMPGGGRPKGSKDSKPRIRNKQAAEEIREALTEAFATRQPEIIERIFGQLRTLEGYAYISAVSVVLKQIMPQLQSISLESTDGNGDVSPLILRIQQLKSKTK